MKKQLILIFSILLTLISCETSSDCEFAGNISISIELNTAESTKPINNVHIYGFSASGQFNTHEYFTSKAELDAYRLSILRDGYTVIAVVNVGEDFIPMSGSGTGAESGDLATTTLTDFITWLKGVEPQYPDIMSGIGGEPVDNNGIMTIFIDLNDGSDVRSTRLRLHVNLLDGELPHYNTRVANHKERIVAEVYRKGTTTRIHSRVEILNDSLDLHLAPGEYDILLWADHSPIGSADDHHYSTSYLREVQFNDEKEYVPGEAHRQGFAHKLQVEVEDKPITTKRVDMPLAMAKYRIVATDVERYKSFIAANGYPNLEDLVVTIDYQGFFPSSYDVYKNEPNSASRTISYTTSLSDITSTTATIGGDYIFANDVNSFINTTITVSNKTTGTIITKVSNVRIDHIRGHLTTIEFDYLTAGIVDSGVTIDTRWEGVYDVTF